MDVDVGVSKINGATTDNAKRDSQFLVSAAIKMT